MRKSLIVIVLVWFGSLAISGFGQEVPRAVLVDEHGRLPCDDLLGRLDAYFAELAGKPAAQGVVVRKKKNWKEQEETNAASRDACGSSQFGRILLDIGVDCNYNSYSSVIPDDFIALICNLFGYTDLKGEVSSIMLFARFYGLMSLAFAALIALFYFAGAFTDGLTITVGFVASVLLGAFLLAVYPAMLSERVHEWRLARMPRIG